VRNKTYYEILGVSPHVGSGQIQSAYRFARGLYSGEAAATCGLLSAEERTQMLALVEEAYAALSNPSVRRDYDAHLSDARTLVSIEPQAPPVEMRAPRRAAHAAASAPALPPEAPGEVVKVPELVNGSVLRALRESRHLSIDQISALSKVGARFLRALEEDRHAALPGRVFARGFLIEYARAVRAPESEIVERYLRHWTAN
jgi:curved DNA-binding protein CbpA